MDTINCIRTRYSCREYSTQPVDRSLLEQIIDAGRRAPSGRKEEPVEFVVVTDGTIRQWLAQLTNYGKFIAVAPACIVVMARDVTYYLEDGAAAVENVLLAATALGVQSCWVAGDKKPYAREILDRLGAPPGYKLVALLAIGYARQPGRQPEHRSLEQVLHWEKYGGK